MDELFEVLTLVQTGKVAPVPILLFREAWWRRIVNFEAMAEEGVISPDDLELFAFVETAEQACAAIENFYGEGE
jgi:predicted Rossmann-fold nucleotide-binding protein